MATLFDIKRLMHDELDATYGRGEATAIIRLIFHKLKGWTASDLIINENMEVSDFMQGEINNILLRLRRHEPIQYILSEAYFYGMTLKVDRNVLIPRPETAELVDMIVKENRASDLRVLDVGTGSGAIAIALSRNLRFPKVTAIDISEGALAVARSNAKAFKAVIDFVHADIFTYSPAKNSFDIIVSNPPYIDESEKAEMERNVIDYEPHLALFVPDDSPIVYYSRIAEIGRDALTDGGRLYFEINPRHAEALVAMLEKEGYREISVTQDSYRRQRFISCMNYR